MEQTYILLVVAGSILNAILVAAESDDATEIDQEAIEARQVQQCKEFEMSDYVELPILDGVVAIAAVGGNAGKRIREM